MENPNDLPELSPKEKIKAENELLKMKLTAEFGMQGHDSSLDPELENEWLKYIYHFEQEYSEVKRIRIFDFIGKPEYKKYNDLKNEDVESELDRLFEIMHKNGISLDFICDYEQEIVYRFVTEEFFEMETDDFRIKGMFHCFLYEEFHPNHEYDIRKLAEDFFKGFFETEWKAEFAKFQFNETVIFSGREINLNEFSDILQAYRESVLPVKLLSDQITEMHHYPESETGDINGELVYTAREGKPEEVNFSGSFKIKCRYNDYYWVIYEISFPGLE